MNILPERLPFLSDDLSRKGALTRLTADGLVAGRLLKECDYDSLVVNCLPEVSEALRAAEVIGSASNLIHLRARGAHDGSSKQVMRIDVLCAEVDEETEEFRRFVIFEDKLFRRPEAHRDVLGQILDYRVALRDIEPNSMASLLHDEQQAWVTANRDLMRDALRNGKFLLVVCGDRIRPRLLKYLRDLGEQMDPMFAADFAVLSLALYSDGTTHLLIPHVVVRTEVKRWLKIDLTLRDQSGAEVAVHGGTVDRQPTIVKQDPPPRTQIELEQLRSAILETAGAGALRGCQQVVCVCGRLRCGGNTGLRIGVSTHP